MFPQNWPHIALTCDKVGGAYTFQDLDVCLFVTGELTLLSSHRISPDEHEGRIRLLRQLMSLSRVYEWAVIMKLYTEVVSQIEHGLIIWASSFETTIQWALANYNSTVQAAKAPVNKTETHRSQYAKKSSGKTRPTYCKEYQTNACTSPEDKHWGMVNGERRMVEHICAACLMRKKEVVHHSEMSSECPSKGSTSRNSRQ